MAFRNCNSFYIYTRAIFKSSDKEVGHLVWFLIRTDVINVIYMLMSICFKSTITFKFGSTFNKEHK